MILDYLQVNTAYNLGVIPHRQTITFLSKISGTAQLWHWNDEQAAAQQITALPDRVVEVHHSPCGTKTVVGMDNKGDERIQFYLVKEDGAVVEPLTDAPQYFHYFGGWSACGTYIAWASNRRHPGKFDLYTQNVDTKESKEVYRYDGPCRPVGWHPNGKKLYFSVATSNLDNELLVLDLQTNTAERLWICSRPASYQSLQISKDGEYGYIITDRDSDTAALYRFSLEEGDWECLVHFPKWDVELYKLSADQQTCAFTVNEGGISALYAYSLTERKRERAEGIPSGVIKHIAWLSDDRIAFDLISPTVPGDIWTYGWAGKLAERVTHISHSETIAPTLVEPELRTFQSFDGLEVPYFFYAKGNEEKRPVVVYVHGGPESQIRAEYHPVFQYLANQGFIVVAPNVRGSSGYGRTYITLDDRRKRMDSVADLAYLAKELSTLGEVNPQAIGIMGRSYGGFMVLAALTHYPDIWAAGVDIVGIGNFRTFLQNTGEWRRKLREAEYGSLDEDSDFFEEIAPINHLEKITAPLLVFHGRNDTRVPVSEAEQLVAEMTRRGQAVDLHIFEDEGHFTEKVSNHITMNQKIVQFFLEHLRAKG